MKQLWIRYRFLFILILILFCSFPLLSLFQRTMFWDITLYNLPWRYHLSECIHHGELPLWNPWMNNGFPQFAHAETWYPVSWIFSLLFGYNISTLQYEYLFNLLMAGIGFYTFTSLFKNLNENLRIVGAGAYMLCGVFISQASQLGYVTSGAWMVFVFYFLIKFIQQPTFRNGMLLVFFYFLLVTGGYPGNYIIITYICLVITPIYIYYLHRKNQNVNLKKFFLYSTLSIIVFFCLYLVALIPSLELQNYMTRGALEYTNKGFGAMTGSTSLSGYLSLLSPSASIAKNDFWGEYPMLNDVYFGVLNFLVAVFFLIKGKGTSYYKLSWILFSSALVFLMISVATLFPIHFWIYKIVPFVDRFRFPSLFRIFFVFQFILISLFAWQFLIEHKNKIKEFLIFCTVVLIIGIPFIINQHIEFNLNELISNSDEGILSFSQASLITIDIIVFGLLLLILWFNYSRKKSFSLIALIILFIADISIHTWIRSPRFVSRSNDPSEIQQALNNIPDDYSLPNQTVSQKNAHKQYKPIDGLWLNTYAYYKYPNQAGSSPYATHMYKEALQDGTFEKFSKQPLVFIVDNLNSLSVDSILTQKIIPTSASANSFEFETENAKNKWIVFNHNYYPGWEFYSAKNKLEKTLIHPNYMTFKIENDNEKIEIKFKPNYIAPLFYLSAFTFISLILYLLISQIKIFKSKMN